MSTSFAIIGDGQSERFTHSTKSSNIGETLHSLVIPCLQINQNCENQQPELKRETHVNYFCHEEAYLSVEKFRLNVRTQRILGVLS